MAKILSEEYKNARKEEIDFRLKKYGPGSAAYLNARTQGIAVESQITSNKGWFDGAFTEGGLINIIIPGSTQADSRIVSFKQQYPEIYSDLSTNSGARKSYVNAEKLEKSDGLAEFVPLYNEIVKNKDVLEKIDANPSTPLDELLGDEGILLNGNLAVSDEVFIKEVNLWRRQEKQDKEDEALTNALTSKSGSAVAKDKATITATPTPTGVVDNAATGSSATVGGVLTPSKVTATAAQTAAPSKNEPIKKTAASTGTVGGIVKVTGDDTKPEAPKEKTEADKFNEAIAKSRELDKTRENRDIVAVTAKPAPVVVQTTTKPPAPKSTSGSQGTGKTSQAASKKLEPTLSPSEIAKLAIEVKTTSTQDEQLEFLKMAKDVFVKPSTQTGETKSNSTNAPKKDDMPTVGAALNVTGSQANTPESTESFVKFLKMYYPEEMADVQKQSTPDQAKDKSATVGGVTGAAASLSKLTGGPDKAGPSALNLDNMLTQIVQNSKTFSQSAVDQSSLINTTAASSQTSVVNNVNKSPLTQTAKNTILNPTNPLMPAITNLGNQMSQTNNTLSTINSNLLPAGSNTTSITNNSTVDNSTTAAQTGLPNQTPTADSGKSKDDTDKKPKETESLSDLYLQEILNVLSSTGIKIRQI